MKVQEVMEKEVLACRLGTDLGSVAGMMWEADCGVIPVVDQEERVVGTITDRDICMATAINHRNPDEIPAATVLAREVQTCLPTDELKDVLETMKRFHIHRIPVTGKDGKLEGILSFTDILRRVELKGTGLEPMQIVETLREIRNHEPKAVKAAGRATKTTPPPDAEPTTPPRAKPKI